jgi:hypothetical protein
MITKTGVLMYPPLRLHSAGLNYSFDEGNAVTRFYLTYFERVRAVGLDMLKMSMVRFSSAELHALIESGVIDKFANRIVSTGQNDSQFLSDDISNVTLHSNNEDNGYWAVSSPVGLVCSGNATAWNGISLTLRNMLPSPSIDVPIAEIIDFRNKHAAHFARFHTAIDILSLQLTREGKIEIDLFERNMQSICMDIQEIMELNRFPWVRLDISIHRAIEAALVAAATAGAIAIGIDPIIAAGAAGLIEVRALRSPLAIINNRIPKDFQYIVHGFKEFGRNNATEYLYNKFDIKNLQFNANTYAAGIVINDQIPRLQDGSISNNILI